MQITNIRNEREDITTDPLECNEKDKEIFEKTYANTYGNLEEMNQFLEIY